jgi:hypothetical protein
MTLLDRLKAPAGRKVLYVTTVSVIVVYLVGISFLAKLGLLEHKDFIQNLAIFVGWIVTLLLAIIHIRETQKDNQLGRREEVKRSLEKDAFRNVNEALTKFSEVISTITTPYRTVPVQLQFYRRELAISVLQDFLNVKLPQQSISLWNGLTPFILAIESNEIAIIKYDHLRKFIQFRVDDAQEAIRKFQQYVQSTAVEVLLSKEGLEDFKRECKSVEEALVNVTMYLFDYRIELMNCLLGDIFETQVPRRKPIDPRYKTLVEIATKETVEDEGNRKDAANVTVRNSESKAEMK